MSCVRERADGARRSNAWLPRARRCHAALSGLGVAAALLFARPATAQGPSADVVPPVVRSHVDAVYPPAALGAREHGDVTLLVTVDVDGHVSAVEVSQSGGADLDEAATVAARQWTFGPALRGSQAIASRIRIPFHFAPPAPPPELVTPPKPAVDTLPTQPAVQTQPAAPAASAPSPTAPNAPPAPGVGGGGEVVVLGHAQPAPHGASDFQIPIGQLARVPRKNATDLLTLAPGVLLTNEGGEGHAEQVFLRGFDAREGQDIEFSVDGVPANDSGNLHGNGYADTHFILPELVVGLRVIEGPFSPSQGNYAVAGSAEYELGLETRGETVKATYGSWNTQRLLVLWGPKGESTHTFGGAEVYKTDGYGQNRAATRGSAMAQYEIALPGGASLRLGGQAYATHFLTAGVVRQDDYRAGRVDFYGTEDALQGGDASRFSLYATYDKSTESSVFQQTAFLVRRDMRLREDFTGYLLDTQQALDTLHPQRGDLIDLNHGAWTMGGRGFGRWSTLLNGLTQSLDVGYLARVDLVDGTQYRNSVPGDIPYRLETDLHSTLTDVGLYADAALRPVRWVTLRGGARIDTFDFNVLNGCAAQGDFDNPSKTQPPINQSCHDQVQFGAHREPVQRSSTGASKVMPRATATLGPFSHANLSFSYGEGVRSIDPSYISQDLATPFASVRAYEGGVVYAHDLGPVALSARSIFFETKVDRDLVFSETEGRNVLSNGTTRTGWAGALRLTNSYFDESANVTLVRPTFDDTHLQVPYVPTLVVREDAVVLHELPWQLAGRRSRASLGVGWTFVGRRALPYNEQSDIISVIDANASFGVGTWETSLSVMNLLDRRYRLGEYNYASDFHSAAEPTLVPARHFTAGAPRGVFISLASTFGGAS